MGPILKLPLLALANQDGKKGQDKFLGESNIMRSKLGLVAAAFLAVAAVKPANAQTSLALLGLSGAAAAAVVVVVVGVVAVAASGNNGTVATTTR